MELRFSGQFNRDIEGLNRRLSEEIKNAILNVKKASSVKKIQNLKKLLQYRTLYRIRLGNYRIGVIIRGNKVWFMRFGHRNAIYKYFP